MGSSLQDGLGVIRKDGSHRAGQGKGQDRVQRAQDKGTEDGEAEVPMHEGTPFFAAGEAYQRLHGLGDSHGQVGEDERPVHQDRVDAGAIFPVQPRRLMDEHEGHDAAGGFEDQDAEAVGDDVPHRPGVPGRLLKSQVRVEEHSGEDIDAEADPGAERGGERRPEHAHVKAEHEDKIEDHVEQGTGDCRDHGDGRMTLVLHESHHQDIHHESRDVAEKHAQVRHGIGKAGVVRPKEDGEGFRDKVQHDGGDASGNQGEPHGGREILSGLLCLSASLAEGVMACAAHAEQEAEGVGDGKDRRADSHGAQRRRAKPAADDKGVGERVDRQHDHRHHGWNQVPREVLDWSFDCRRAAFHDRHSFLKQQKAGQDAIQLLLNVTSCLALG